MNTTVVDGLILEPVIQDDGELTTEFTFNWELESGSMCHNSLIDVDVGSDSSDSSRNILIVD